MKKRIFILGLMLTTELLFSQKKEACHAGVYITSDDFIKKHLSYEIDKNKDGNKLEFTFPADVKFTIKIIKSDTVFKFKPGTIYGYFDCGKNYRYFEGGKELNTQEDFYKLEEEGHLIIYSSEFISGTENFYSISLTSPIHRLTVASLENDFNKYPEFIDEVKRLKTRPEGLATRDEAGNFIINKLYKENIKHK